MEIMEIYVDDIPPGGLEIEATESHGWLMTVIKEVVGEAFTSEDRAKVQVEVTKVGGNVTIDGILEWSAHPSCDRCLVLYPETMTVSIHVVLAPLYESARQQKREEGMEVELVREDLEFGYYEGDCIDVDDIIREQALLGSPMKHLCHEDCRGLCQRCGRNLNTEECTCEEARMDPRWAALKGIELSKKTPKLKKGGKRAASKRR